MSMCLCNQECEKMVNASSWTPRCVILADVFPPIQFESWILQLPMVSLQVPTCQFCTLSERTGYNEQAFCPHLSASFAMESWLGFDGIPISWVRMRSCHHFPGDSLIQVWVKLFSFFASYCPQLFCGWFRDSSFRFTYHIFLKVSSFSRPNYKQSLLFLTGLVFVRDFCSLPSPKNTSVRHQVFDVIRVSNLLLGATGVRSGYLPMQALQVVLPIVEGILSWKAAKRNWKAEQDNIEIG